MIAADVGDTAAAADGPLGPAPNSIVVQDCSHKTAFGSPPLSLVGECFKNLQGV